MIDKDVLLIQTRVDEMQRRAKRRMLAEQVQQFKRQEKTPRMVWRKRRWLRGLQLRQESLTDDLLMPVVHVKSEI